MLSRKRNCYYIFVILSKSFDLDKYRIFFGKEEFKEMHDFFQSSFPCDRKRCAKSDWVVIKSWFP